MPDWKPEIRQRLANLNLLPTHEAAMVEELAQRLEDRHAESLSGGATEDDRVHACSWRTEIAADILLSAPITPEGIVQCRLNLLYVLMRYLSPVRPKSDTMQLLQFRVVASHYPYDRISPS
jgi:hypothetical protein